MPGPALTSLNTGHFCMMNGAGSFEQRSFYSFPGCGRGMSVREAPASPPELCDQSAKCLHPNVVPISAEFQIPDVDRAHAAAELRKRAEETEQIHPINQSTYWNSLLIISACATSGHGVLIRPGRFIFANIRRCCSANRMTRSTSASIGTLSRIRLNSQAIRDTSSLFDLN